MLGNYRLDQIVKADYLDKIQKFLDDNGYKMTFKCDDVEKELGNYHIYDIPRVMVVCGEEKMDNFITFLKENNLVGKAFIGQVGLSYLDKI